jgi:hypothetical protein
LSFLCRKVFHLRHCFKLALQLRPGNQWLSGKP